ncbi:rRNA processing protein Rrp36 [Schizosaccharomyces pombe]|uniref:rRNA biogenesis protein rrp36 n=1 Tax=Schizosaccharomyces pombe (strain 972 / ATCC 24843) TaxID=284812 RepID=RRP36_SCHPO
MKSSSLENGTLANAGVYEDDLDSDEELVSEEEFENFNNEDSEDDEDSNNESKTAKSQLAEIPFDTLLNAQRDLLKEQQKTKDNDRKNMKHTEKVDQKIFGERKKHAPQELSSKKPVSRFREVISEPKKFTRDPRFDSLSGNLSKDKVKKNYGFLNEYRVSEIQQLRDELKICKDQERAESIRQTLKSLLSKMERHLEEERAERVMHEFRAQEKERVKEGKKPFYLKRNEQKKLIQMDKYKSMEGTKALDKYIEKKRRRRAQKEKKHLPRARPSANSQNK